MIKSNSLPLFQTRDGVDVYYEDLLKDIYSNNEDTRTDIAAIVKKLAGMVDDPVTAVSLMTHVSELLNCRIKNDDLLVKFVAILNKTREKQKDVETPWIITPEERVQLLEEAKELVIPKQEAS